MLIISLQWIRDCSFRNSSLLFSVSIIAQILFIEQILQHALLFRVEGYKS